MTEHKSNKISTTDKTVRRNFFMIGDLSLPIQDTLILT